MLRYPLLGAPLNGRVTAVKLLAKRVRFRGQARIWKLSPASSISALRDFPTESPSPGLPQEVVEIIITHLIYDTHSLLACSLTCRSWYTASVPHLHHTFTTRTRQWPRRPKHWWPNSLQNASKLGLLPFVKRLRVHDTEWTTGGFSKSEFNRRTLRQFSALANVQELEIHNLDIPSFLPTVQRYFGHFPPTVRSLALRTPKGSHRQIIYFIGLFQHLNNLLLTSFYRRGGEPAEDPALIPPFTPPLRGRLVMANFKRAGFVKDMIDLFGGIRFSYVDLSNVGDTRLLLNACAKTLETLRIYPNDLHGEQLYPKRMSPSADDFVARPFLEDFDLSQNGSLRTIELTARSINYSHGSCGLEPAILNFLKTTLSTVTSPVFSEVAVFYGDYDFSGLTFRPRSTLNVYRAMTLTERAGQELWHRRLFKAFREMYTVRDFRLVLCVDVWDHVGEYTVKVVKQAVAAEKAAGRLDYLLSEPMVVYSPRGSMEY